MSNSIEALMRQGKTVAAKNARAAHPVHPPQVRMAFNVGVTGHRKLSVANRPALTETISRILVQIKQSLSDAKGKPALGLVPFSAEEPVRLRVVSPIAAGADQIVAEAGLDLGYTLHCPLPFERARYADSFHDCDKPALEGYWQLLDRAERVLELNGDYDNAPDLAYQVGGRVVLTYSDILIAIWDGQREKGTGGTAQIVREAYARGLPVVWINPTRENEVGWYDEEGGQVVCRPIREFGGLLNTQSLGDVIDRAYTPPKSVAPEGPGQPEMSPEESVQTYFRERRVQLRSRIVMRYLSRLWPTFYRSLSPPVGSVEYHPPTGPAVEHYQVADDLAQHYGNMYRSSFLANYLLGAAAVLMAMLGPVLQQFFSEGSEWREWAARSCTILELLSLSVIYVNFRLARTNRWHDKLTDYRMLAEQLRHLEFVMPLGLLPSARAFGHDPDHPDEHWTTWHVRNLVHQVGILPGDLNDGRYRGAIEGAIRDNWIKEQRDYHRGNAARCNNLEHKLHGFAIVLFFLTVAACIGHLVAPEEHVPWLPSLLTLLAAVCPTWAGAAHAIGQYAELRRLERRSRAMESELRRMAITLEKGALPSAQLNELAFRAAEMMLQEAFDWRIQYRMSELIPG
jgi:hypothetical protein